MSDKMPPHVAAQRAEFASGKRATQLRRRGEANEHYDVFKRINMHSGSKDVCWEWLGAHGLGTRGEYRPRVVIQGRDYYVYRVVYQLYTGYILQKGDVIRHQCDHPWCCNPYHMVIGTQADNVQDMLDRERIGLKHYQVKRIMQMLELGCTAKYVSQKMREGYNVSLDVSVIKRIRMRNIYKHIPWEWGDKYADARHKRLDDIKKQRLASDPTCAILSDTNPSEGASADAKEDDK